MFVLCADKSGEEVHEECANKRKCTEEEYDVKNRRMSNSSDPKCIEGGFHVDLDDIEDWGNF